MKVLNLMRGFQWASPVNEKGWAKVCINNESFWITDCESGTVNEQKGFFGKVANNVDECQNLAFGEIVGFVPTLE